MKYKIDLLPHNIRLFNKGWKLFKKHSKLALCSPTGTGKSYLASEFIHKCTPQKNDRALVFSPTSITEDQFLKADTDIRERATFFSYQGLDSENTKNTISFFKKNFNVTLIVLDEFHRLGAEKWGSWIKRIQKKFPGVPIIGSSATPNRYTDGFRNMADEIFDGIIVEYTLQQAIKDGVLPKPNYHTVFVEPKHDLKSLTKRIKKSKDKAVVEELQKDVSRASLHWDNTDGPIPVLAQYLRKGDFKGIVFCEQIKEIAPTMKLVTKWFNDSRIKNKFSKKLKFTQVHSKQPEKEQERAIKNFREDSNKDYFHIIFCVNILNESFHDDNLTFGMFLRSTESPNVYMQQLGRVMTVGGSRLNPTVFDFVCNIQSIRIKNTGGSVEISGSETTNLKEEFVDVINMYNHRLRMEKILEAIEYKLQPWNYMYEKLKKLIVSGVNYLDIKNTDENLFKWVVSQIYGRKKLPDEKVALLEALNIPWTGISELSLLEYKKNILILHNKLRKNRLSKKDKSVLRDVLNYVRIVRRREKLNRRHQFSYSRSRKILLFEKYIEPYYIPANATWNLHFKKYEKCVKKYPFILTYRSYNGIPLNTEQKEAVKWAKCQRINIWKRKVKISKEILNYRIKKLLSINFCLDTLDAYAYEAISKLKAEDMSEKYQKDIKFKARSRLWFFNIKKYVKGNQFPDYFSKKTIKACKIAFLKIEKKKHIFGRNSPVKQYNLQGKYIATFKSLAEATFSITGNRNGNIGLCCKGILKTAYGFKWEYANNG